MSVARPSAARSVELEVDEDGSEKTIPPTFAPAHMNSHSHIHPNDTNKVAMIIGAYFFVSLTLTMFNKITLVDTFFPYPTIVTAIQFNIQLLCFYILSRLGKSVSELNFIPPFEFDLQLGKRMLPVAIIYICMTVSNNVCLYYVEVSFYSVARGLTIPFTLLFSYVFLQKKASMEVIGACGVVVFGFLLGSFYEINLSLVGLGFGVLASMFYSLYGVVVKSVIQTLNDDFWRLLVYNSFIACVLMIPIVLVSGELMPMLGNPNLFHISIWMVNIAGGVLGFLLNVVIFLQLKYTSPLTNSVCGNSKSVVQTVLGFLFFRNPLSFMNVLGTLLIVLGSGLYSFIRFQEMRTQLRLPV